MQQKQRNKNTFDIFLKDEDFLRQCSVSLLLQEKFLLVFQEDFSQTDLEVTIGQDLVTDSGGGDSAVDLQNRLKSS